jgi:hypothetical protein
MASSSWAAFKVAEPGFAETVQARFEQHKHHILATLRKEGSPRVTGLEVNFCFGELWLGMMPNSRKALDLRRDPRFAVHANPGPDDAMEDADVRVCGHAVEEADPDALARFIGEVKPPEPFHLFRTELTEVVSTGVENEDLVVRVWRPGKPLRTIHRAADDDSPRETT